MNPTQERITILANQYREQALRIRQWGEAARELQRRWERECRVVRVEA